jgi:hypothetical protein
VLVRVQIYSDVTGCWSVKLPSHEGKFTAGSLFEAFDYAKHACAAAPAIIELFSAEGYVFSVVEDQGWPQPVCATADRRTYRPSMIVTEILSHLGRLFLVPQGHGRLLPAVKMPRAAPHSRQTGRQARPA